MCNSLPPDHKTWGVQEEKRAELMPVVLPTVAVTAVTGFQGIVLTIHVDEPTLSVYRVTHPHKTEN
jgi:hypothetical protein